MDAVVAVQGDDKTGKTSLALSFPGPIFHMDLDVGGFRRASWRYEDKVKSGELVSVSYYTPQQALRERLSPEQMRMAMAGGVATKEKVTFKQSKRLVGMKELWYRMLSDYVDVITEEKLSPTGKPFQTVVWDSFSQTWELCRLGFLQEKQENQPDREKPRESLLAIEYSEPNARMRAMVYAARECGKNLVLTHYMTDKYEKVLVGEKVEDRVVGQVAAGWKYIGKECDMLVETSTLTKRVDGTAKLIPHAKILLCGLSMEMTGLEFDNPNWEEIHSALTLYRTL